MEEIQHSLKNILPKSWWFQIKVVALQLKITKNNKNMETAVFNPVQQHLLKMFAFDGSEARLAEVKTVLADYFRKKADACLDDLWDSGKLNQAKLDELRHQDLHALID